MRIWVNSNRGCHHRYSPLIQFGVQNSHDVKLSHEGKDLDPYLNFHQARIKNNDMLLLKQIRKSTLQGPMAQRNVNSNYLNSQNGNQGVFGAGAPFCNASQQQRTSNDQYGSFAGGGYNQSGSRASYQPPQQNRPPYQSTTNNGAYSREPIRQNALPLSQAELSMQKEIEKKIHFERMNRNL